MRRGASAVRLPSALCLPSWFSADGYGIISNITYENLHITDPLWWGIYIGPQQQKQPGGSGPGCMIYPLDDNCPTQVRWFV